MVLFAVLLLAAFATLTGSVLSGAAAGADTAIHEWFLEIRDENLTTGAVAVTHAGGSAVMWVLALTACGWLLWRGRRADAALVAGVGAAAAVLVPVSKGLIGRARPPLEHRLVAVDSAAFPSGHSTGAVAVTGVLAVLCYLRLRHRLAARCTVTLAAVFVGLVGLSRVYLGVHWATDVLAGWSLGALLVLCGVLVHRRADRSAPPDEPDLAVPTGSVPRAEVAPAARTAS
ncbi:MULTISPECIES: phosphatase PAP2 family protein [Nocardia]|uniref:phosphatase PAP2 family protein n=1 Tax=Nocardia TaxID=1817 RepID=UPI0018931E16|nr:MULTISPECIES: phosphatase PAP2 family protein [Nocardia]MBF6347777.1 phosphatase PAP2 family protein [Nocardia flavorosea]